MPEKRNDIRYGKGLAKLQWALASLDENPFRLARARRKFDKTPPLEDYWAELTESMTPTRVITPTRSEKQRQKQENKRQRQEYKRQRREGQLIIEKEAVQPKGQFRYECETEERMVPRAGFHRVGPHLTGSEVENIAKKNVKDKWVEEGIWDVEWSETPGSVWKHEKPFTPEHGLQVNFSP